MGVLGVMFLKGESYKEIYNSPNSGAMGIGSLYVSGFLLGFFEAYCTLKGTWGGLEEQFHIISVMAENPLSSFIIGFLGVILIWGVFAIIGAIVTRNRGGDPVGVAVVTACATIPLCVTILFPILDYCGVTVVPFLGIPLGWLITLIAFVWVIAAEIRAITSIP